MTRKNQQQCFWCGRNMTTAPMRPNTRTREHVVPRSLGGSSSGRNVQFACAHCNHTRGTEQWIPFSHHKKIGYILRAGATNPERLPSPEWAR